MSCADVFVVLCRSVSSSVHVSTVAIQARSSSIVIYLLPPPSVPGRGAEGLFVPRNDLDFMLSGVNALRLDGFDLFNNADSFVKILHAAF